MRRSQVLNADTAIPVTSLFHYEGAMRELILQAKVHSVWRTAQFLMDLAANDSQIAQLVAWADILVPAPSSAWGRLRGRFDLAQLTTARLAKEHTKTMQLPPGRLFWRWRKRAQATDREQHNAFASQSSGNGDSKEKTKNKIKILFIDDIITTGFTMRELFAYYPNTEIQVLTLASALPVEPQPHE